MRTSEPSSISATGLTKRFGYGQYFPWTVPALYTGSAEALTGEAATSPSLVSYILVGLVWIHWPPVDLVGA